MGKEPCYRCPISVVLKVPEMAMIGAIASLASRGVRFHEQSLVPFAAVGSDDEDDFDIPS